MNLRKILGLKSAQEKISEYRELKRQLASMDLIGKQLSDRFMLQKSIIDDSDSLPTEKRGEILGKYNEFLKEHQKEVSKAMNDRNKIIKSMERLRSSEDISEAIQNIDLLDKATESYRKGNLKKSAYFEIVKSISGEPVKYADVIARSNDGRILVLHRVENFVPTGMVCLPGGHVDPGEDFQTAALRELKEETNLDPIPGKGIVELGEHKTDDAHIKYYEVIVDSNQPVTVDASEHCFSEWIDVPEMKTKPFIFDQGSIALNLLLKPYSIAAVQPLMKALEEGRITKEAFIPSFRACLQKTMETKDESPLTPESMDGDTKEPLEKKKVTFRARDPKRHVDKILKAISGHKNVSVGNELQFETPIQVDSVSYLDAPEKNHLTEVEVIYTGDSKNVQQVIEQMKTGLLEGYFLVKTPHEEFLSVNENGTDYVGDPVFVDF